MLSISLLQINTNSKLSVFYASDVNSIFCISSAGLQQKGHDNSSYAEKGQNRSLRSYEVCFKKVENFYFVTSFISVVLYSLDNSS